MECVSWWWTTNRWCDSCSCASWKRKALEQLNRRAYDLLITDVHMPRMSGIDLVRAVRRQGNRIPLIVMDSYPDLFTESEVGAEAFAMLAKPFDLSEVRRVLQQLEPQPV
jgi:CheY-like chemotaxis protein